MAFLTVKVCRWLERQVEHWPRHWDVAPERVQGLLLTGFEQLPCSTYLLVDFGSARAMGSWLGAQEQPPT